MIVANFLTISSCKHGCQVVLAAVRHFSKPRAAVISVQLTELVTEEEFTELCIHGACNICHFKPLRSLLVKLDSNDCFEDIFVEVKENLIYPIPVL